MKLKKFKFKKVKSTNNTAIRIIKETKHNLGMVVAETQANGRGQYGRKWISSVSYTHLTLPTILLV